MKHGEKMLLCTLASLALCTTANALTSDSPGGPYQGIVERNVFGLKPPPPPPDPEANKPPPPKIFLTGITTMFTNKRALMKMTPPAKPGEPAKEQSFTLGEGQRDGDLEVVAIDEKEGKVKVKYYDTIVDLDFENNGVKAAGAPAGPGVAANAKSVPAPAVNPFPPGAGAGGTVRPLRMPGPAGAANSPAPVSAQAQYGAAGAAAPGVNVNGISLPGFGTATPAVSEPEQNTGPQLTREEQAIILTAQKQRYQNMGSPIANLFPTSPGSLPAQDSSGQTPAASGNNSEVPTPAVPTRVRPGWTPRTIPLPPMPQ